MNEHLEAKISAGQLSLTMIVSRLSMLLFLPMLTNVYSAREYAIASALSYLLSIPFMLSARRGVRRVPAVYQWAAGVYLIFCGAAGVAWLYSFLLSVAENPIPAFLFGAVMICTALYALYCGPEAIARISLILLALFLFCCAFTAITAADRISAANLGVSGAVSVEEINLIAAINVFAHPELALYLLLRSSISDAGRIARGAANYCVWTLGLQCGFFFLLELVYKNAAYTREYPAALLFGNALSAMIFIAVTAVRFYAFTTAATIGLKRRLGQNGAAAAVFIAASAATVLLLHERRAVQPVLVLMLGFGTVIWIFTLILLTIGGGGFDKEKTNRGGSAARDAG